MRGPRVEFESDAPRGGILRYTRWTAKRARGTMAPVYRPRPDRKSLGSVLRAFRQEKGFTQERLSLRSKLTTATISDSENGKHNLSFESIERWLDTLGITWSEFGAALDRASPKKPRA